MIPILLPVLMAVATPPEVAGTVTVRGKTFQVELARTPEERALGLMRRASLPTDRCMFFFYDEDGNYTIWMKNCLIGLDVLWVSANGTIVETAERVPPCSPLRGDDCPAYGGTKVSRYFIEFPAGTFKRLGVKVGDPVRWDLRLPGGVRLKNGAAGKKSQ